MSCASAVLLPMLNINSDLVILRNKLLDFLFTVSLLTPLLKLSIFPSLLFKSGLKKVGQKVERKFLRKLLNLKKEGKVKAISIDEAWSFAGKFALEILKLFSLFKKKTKAFSKALDSLQ